MSGEDVDRLTDELERVMRRRAPNDPLWQRFVEDWCWSVCYGAHQPRDVRLLGTLRDKLAVGALMKPVRVKGRTTRVIIDGSAPLTIPIGVFEQVLPVRLRWCEELVATTAELDQMEATEPS